MMQCQNRKKRQRAKRKENKTEIRKGIRDVKIKETRLGGYEELYITMALRILLGQSLKMSVTVVLTRNINKIITMEKRTSRNYNGK